MANQEERLIAASRQGGGLDAELAEPDISQADVSALVDRIEALETASADYEDRIAALEAP